MIWWWIFEVASVVMVLALVYSVVRAWLTAPDLDRYYEEIGER